MAKNKPITFVRLKWIQDNIGPACKEWTKRKFGGEVLVKELLAGFWDINEKEWAFLLLDALTIHSRINDMWHVACAALGKNLVGNKSNLEYERKLRKIDETLLEAYFSRKQEK